MTSRERIIATLNHEQPDMLAIDFGGLRSSGISAIAYNKLKDYLNIEGGVTKLYDIYQQLAEPEPEVLGRLGGDVVQLHRFAPSFGIPNDRWKPGKLPDGSDCIEPYEFDPVPNEKGDLEVIRDGHAIIKMPKGGLYYDVVYYPYADAETTGDIDRIPIKGIDDAELAYLEKEAKRLYEETDKAILGPFGGGTLECGQGEWGYEKFLLSMAEKPDLVLYWLDKLIEVHFDDLKKYLGAVGKYINVIQFCDDLGTQNAPQISPNMYREMIKPYQKKLYRYVRENYPHVKVFIHCCGAIFDLLPDLIDAGVEIINPVQISAAGMDPQRLKTTFGSELSFWGGGANMQTFVNTNSVEAIRGHVRELIDIFAPGGGFVFNQVHNIQANVPPEKIMAIYDTALEYRKEKRQ